MANWFETRKQAHVERLARINKKPFLDGQIFVFKWKHTKRKKPFFVGSEIEWINQ